MACPPNAEKAIKVLGVGDKRPYGRLRGYSLSILGERQSNRYHGYSRENGKAVLGFIQKGPPQLLLAVHCDIRQCSVKLGAVETVADNKFIGYDEQRHIRLYLDNSPVGLVEQGDDVQ